MFHIVEFMPDMGHILRTIGLVISCLSSNEDAIR